MKTQGVRPSQPPRVRHPFADVSEVSVFSSLPGAAGLRCQRCVRGEWWSTPPALCPAGRTTLWWRRCSNKVPRPSPKTCGRSWLLLYQSTLHFIPLAQVTTRRRLTSPPCSHAAATKCRLIAADSGFWWFLSRAEPGDPCSCPGLEEPDDVGLFYYSLVALNK